MSVQYLIDHLKELGGKREVCISERRLCSVNLPVGVTLKTIERAHKDGLVLLKRQVGTRWYDLSLVHP